MNAFEEDILRTAQSMSGLAQREYAELQPGDSPNWSLWEQRFAVVMVQARARECRHLAGSLLINVGPKAADFARDLTERSHKLEGIALEMAKTWPPVFEETGLVQ